MATFKGIDQVRPFSDLNVYLDKSTDKAPYLGRIWQTVKMIKNDHGYVAATAAASGILIGSVYSFTFSYFCLEGCVRSLYEADESFKHHGRLSQSLGDAGGWLSLPIYSIFALNTTLRQLIREGEFSKIQSFCREWHKKVTSETISISDRVHISVEEFYSNINNILDGVAQQCLSYKSVVNRKLLALGIIESLEGADLEAPLTPTSEFCLDKQLKNIFKEIKSESDKSTKTNNYIHRLRTGLSITKEMHGTSSRNWSIITGIACPIIFAFASVCSAIGIPILGEKIFVQKEDVVEVGHFGEWPDNLVGSVYASFALNRDLLLKGDVYLIACIYQKHLDRLNPIKNPQSGNRELHNRLCEIANEDIQQLNSTSLFYTALNINLFHSV